MNKAKLKSYAPQARKDFIAAVTARANLLGISEKVGDKAGQLDVAASQPQGDVTVIAGQAWPAKVHSQREQLIARIQKDGFVQTMEAVAYTWFNRFAALRYMELHDYLGHGHRALSSEQGTLPDILTHATDLSNFDAANALPGLNAAKVTELKLAGNRDGELYRMLLVAQCNALSRAMPFLFERIDDDSELLLPDNLLRSDSVIAKLVEAIPEEDWAEVEIIGWLYQFYISEKKDQVIGKVVKSEDIPAATQLFTPNWIVQYLVQNSVGRLWLMANPQSTLAQAWPYYITPAEQTPEVQAQLDALIQTRVRQDGDTLNPESITVLDPACGSGHILVVAYDVLKAIYLERGYQPRAIPRLILEKNLFGLDIDDRAAQMAGFALLMKARADDRRLFTATDDAGNLQPCSLNVLSLQESKGLDADVLTRALQLPGHSREGGNPEAPRNTSGFGDDDLFPGTHPQISLGESSAADTAGDPAIAALIATFEHAKTFGSLIQIPQTLISQLAVLTEKLQLARQNGDLYAKAAAQDLWPLVAQAQVLAMQFDAVVANPPYMGSKNMNASLKEYVNSSFPDEKSDLFSVFIKRGFDWCKALGFNSQVTIQSWLFLSSYENMRKVVLEERSVFSLVQIGYNSFPELNSKVVQCAAMISSKYKNTEFVGRFVNLNSASQSADKKLVFDQRDKSIIFDVKQSDLLKIPGNALAYWANRTALNHFSDSQLLGEMADLRSGISTGDNDVFYRAWFEVSRENVNFKSNTVTGGKWFPIVRGGDFRRWYGNRESVINLENDGADIIESKNNYRLRSKEYYTKVGVTWSRITSGLLSFRLKTEDVNFGENSPCLFSLKDEFLLLSILNSKVAGHFLSLISPTLSNQVVDVAKIPVKFSKESTSVAASRLVEIHKSDWDRSEMSWDFCGNELTKYSRFGESMMSSWSCHLTETTERLDETKELEESNNKFIINAYDLQDELSPEVPESQITLARADREKDCQRLISYAIGCMMGRYSLDEPGLIYAHAGNVGFEPGRYVTFPADADGIVPITDELWFADDAPSRIREFLRAVWGPDTLEDNMAWLAESLGTKASETPDETIRRYLADKFFKDHLQTYKKRPIYWLFSSGKQGAFQALVYLHRYHEGTLARLRAEYVVPLTGKIQSRIDMLQKDKDAASSTAARNKLAKEVEKLKKKHVELLAYDEQLRHHADMRITLDLDDGVKVNYGKFGELLAETKAVTGGSGDE
jgi:hypothetical protein